MSPPTARFLPASRPSPSPPPASWPAKPCRPPYKPRPRPPKKGAPARRCPACAKLAWDKGHAGRNVLTAAGVVRLNRLSLRCPRCGSGHYPLDERLGLEGFVSPQAKKLLTLAGASWSFAGAARHLAEFCGLRTCHQTIRQVCYQEAGLMADWLHGDKAAGAGFAAADGDIEFQTDGTMVNTWEGWREIRPGIFAKRRRGQPASVGAWDSRRLPTPQARLLFGGIETAEHFGPRIRRWAGRLGIRDPATVSVLADGAEWIWNQAAVQLPGAAGLLDIYHAGEHLAACVCTVRERRRRGPGWKRAVQRCWRAVGRRWWSGRQRHGDRCGRRRSGVRWTSWRDISGDSVSTWVTRSGWRMGNRSRDGSDERRCRRLLPQRSTESHR